MASGEGQELPFQLGWRALYRSLLGPAGLACSSSHRQSPGTRGTPRNEALYEESGPSCQGAMLGLGTKSLF